jgi:hypothetical protein
MADYYTASTYTVSDGERIDASDLNDVNEAIEDFADSIESDVDGKAALAHTHESGGSTAIQIVATAVALTAGPTDGAMAITKDEYGNKYTWDNDNTKWRIHTGNYYTTAALPIAATYTIPTGTVVWDVTTGSHKEWDSSSWVAFEAPESTLADEAADTTTFPVIAGGATGSQALKTNSSLTYDASDGTLGATSFSGSASSLTALANLYKVNTTYDADSARTLTSSDGPIVLFNGTMTQNRQIKLPDATTLTVGTIPLVIVRTATGAWSLNLVNYTSAANLGTLNAPGTGNTSIILCLLLANGDADGTWQTLKMTQAGFQS